MAGTPVACSGGSQDLLKVIYALDYYKSCDWSELTYCEAVKDFKDKWLFKKMQKEVAMRIVMESCDDFRASLLNEKIPNPEAQVGAKLIDVGLLLFNGKDGKIDMEQLGKLVARKDDLLNASGIVDPNMSAGKIYSNKMMANMRNGLSFDAAEKDTIGFMSKLMSPEKLSKMLDGKSLNFLNGGSIGMVKSTVDTLKPKEMGENTKSNTLSLGSVFGGRNNKSRGGRE